MNKAEYLMKNYGDQGGDNTLREGEGEGVFDIIVFPLSNEFDMKIG